MVPRLWLTRALAFLFFLAIDRVQFFAVQSGPLVTVIARSLGRRRRLW